MAISNTFPTHWFVCIEQVILDKFSLVYQAICTAKQKHDLKQFFHCSVLMLFFPRAFFFKLLLKASLFCSTACLVNQCEILQLIIVAVMTILPKKKTGKDKGCEPSSHEHHNSNQHSVSLSNHFKICFVES